MAAKLKPVAALEFELLDAFIARGKTSSPPNWLIPQIVPSQGSLLLQGTPGGGKTWLCLVIAKEAAKKKRPVFFIEEESGCYAMAKRFSEVNFPPDAKVYVLHRKSFRVDIWEQLRALAASMMSAAAPVVILDPLVHIWVGDENKTADVSLLVQQLAVLRGFEDALIVIPTHISKGANNGERPSIYGARGSSVLAGWFDCILNVEFVEREPGTEAMMITPVKSRDLEMYDSRKLVLTKGTGDVSICSERDDRAAKMQADICAFVGSRGEASANEIEKAMGGRHAWVRTQIEGLVAIGKLEPFGSPKGGARSLRLAMGSPLRPIKGDEVGELHALRPVPPGEVGRTGRHWTETEKENGE